MTTNSRRIATVKAQPDYHLKVVWQDGGEAVVDMRGIINKLAYFAPLKDIAAFNQVETVAFGSGIEWANGIDYSADSLEIMASEQAAMTAEEFRNWKKDMKLSSNEMADIFGVSVSTIKVYLGDGRLIPVAVQIACNAMRNDPTILYARFRPRVAGRPRRVVGRPLKEPVHA